MKRYDTPEKVALVKIFYNMHQRCRNPRTNGYKYYGGKGIKVCDEWSKPFSFVNWALENGYKLGLSIDRIDSSLGYCPENCQWLTRRENIKKSHLNRKILVRVKKVKEKPVKPEMPQRKNIGKTALLALGSIDVTVTITDVKYAYGRIDYEVQPVSGFGKKWVTMEKQGVDMGSLKINKGR